VPTLSHIILGPWPDTITTNTQTKHNQTYIQNQHTYVGPRPLVSRLHLRLSNHAAVRESARKNRQLKGLALGP
jgi:hypothetical protein